jgi:hypothetical protein
MISLFIALLVVSACSLQCSEPNLGKLGDAMRRVISHCDDYKTLRSLALVSKTMRAFALNMPEVAIAKIRQQVLSCLELYCNPIPTEGAWDKFGGYGWMQKICSTCLKEVCECSPKVMTSSLLCHAGLQWRECDESPDVAIYKTLIPSPAVDEFVQLYRRMQKYQIVQMSCSLPIPDIDKSFFFLKKRSMLSFDQYGTPCIFRRPLCKMPDYAYRLVAKNKWQHFACKLTIANSMQEPDSSAVVFRFSRLLKFPVFLADFVKQCTVPYQYFDVQGDQSEPVDMVFPWRPSFLKDIPHADSMWNMLIFTFLGRKYHCRYIAGYNEDTIDRGYHFINSLLEKAVKKEDAIYIKAALCAQYGGNHDLACSYLRIYDEECEKIFYDVHPLYDIHQEGIKSFMVCQNQCVGRHEFRDSFECNIENNGQFSDIGIYRSPCAISWSPLTGIRVWERTGKGRMCYTTCSKKSQNIDNSECSGREVKIKRILDKFSLKELTIDNLEGATHEIEYICRFSQLLRADNEHFVEIRQCSHKNILKTRLFVHEHGCKPARGWRPLAYGELHNCIGTIIRATVDLEPAKQANATGSARSLSLIEERIGRDNNKIFVRHIVIPSLLKRDPSEKYFNYMKDPVDAAAGSIVDDSGRDVVGTIVDNLDAVTDKGPVVGILTRFFCQTVACVRDTISSYVVTPTRFVWDVLSMIVAYHSSFSCS